MSNEIKKNDKKEDNKKITFDDIDNLFREDIETYSSDIAEMDSLFNDMKEMYNNTRKSGYKGSFHFAMEQAENLIKLKDTKVKMVDKRSNVKKITVDLKLAISRLKDGNDEEKDSAALAREMYRLIMDEKKINNSEPKTNFEEKVIKNENDDDILAKRAEEIKKKKEESTKKKKKKKDEEEKIERELKEEDSLKDINEPEEKEVVDELKMLVDNGQTLNEENPNVEIESKLEEVEEEEIEEEQEPKEEIKPENNYNGIKFVTTMNKEVIAVDCNYNEVLDVEIPESYKTITITMDEDDNIVAKNADGEIVEIVEI